jgi:hypothetical protein
MYSKKKDYATITSNNANLEQTMTFGLDMITLPSHTSHALQPLDVSCFNPFKTTFKK